jgi:hypothetical protein
VERLALGDLQTFEHDHRMAAGVVVTGLDVTRRESDQHVDVLRLVIPIQDLHLDPLSESQDIDIVLPIEVPSVSDVE